MSTSSSDAENAIAHGLAPHQNPDEYSGVGLGPDVTSTTDRIEGLCGPLLNYKRLSNAASPSPTWHGSVLIVTAPGKIDPRLQLRNLGAAPHGVVNGDPGPSSASAGEPRTFHGERLYEDPRCCFWRFVIDLPLQDVEAKWEYHIPHYYPRSGSDSEGGVTKVFHVPSASQSMRIMFHSCNGFSVGTDMDTWTGAVLWNDVMRQHQEKPIHVMIGGGDQIYNDGIRVTGPLRPWTDISNPAKRRDFPFDENMRAECDDWYLQNYIQWYDTKPFSLANGIIPQLNIWDDHDIIDGFGSYTDHFMKCAVFRGIGSVAYKYYLLFQHHVAPNRSTYTTDSKSTMDGSTPKIDPAQLREAFIMTEKDEDPSYIFGNRPGPYVEERSRSVFTFLGSRIAMLGIDARTERTRHQVNYQETYDKLFSHVDQQLTEANGRIKHFILLLGVPIAYPRLQWLENILRSPIIGPIRFVSKRFGVGGGLFNSFDGNVDLLDDLDDHYTARQHKKERRQIIQRLQALSKKHNVRVTILGGDVHLAAYGRFYSNPRLNIPVEEDYRFITNIVSSAITNKPPPTPVANLLANRNKIHHLDGNTDETLLNLFDKDPGQQEDASIPKKTAPNNYCTMPSRNFALICESQDRPGEVSAPNGTAYRTTTAVSHHNISNKTGNPRSPMHAGEDGCGVEHPAHTGVTKTGLGGPYGLDVTYRVEINPRDPEGKTDGYGLTIPGYYPRATSKSSTLTPAPSTPRN